MQDNYTKLLRHLELPQIDETLLRKVLMRIENEERSQARRGLVIFSFCSCFCLAFLVRGIQLLLGDLAHSNVIELISLFFTNTKDVLAIWQEYALSILESLPGTRIAVLAIIAAALTISCEGLVRTLSSFRTHGLHAKLLTH
ncbi:MAG: hypothetical protein WCJ29_04335 [bacterium]